MICFSTIFMRMKLCLTPNQHNNSNKLHCESKKKGATLTMAITLSILDRFAKFFHCCKQQEISYKTNIRLPTTP